MKIPKLIKSEPTLTQSEDGRAFLETAAATGSPVDFVMRYRLLVLSCKERNQWNEASGIWTKYWALMRKAADLALLQKQPPEPQWRLIVQFVEVEAETRPEKVSLIAARAQRLLLSRLRSRSPEEHPDTPEDRMTILALAYCDNIRKNPNLILNAEKMELKALAIAAEEFSAANEIRQ